MVQCDQTTMSFFYKGSEQQQTCVENIWKSQNRRALGTPRNHIYIFMYIYIFVYVFIYLYIYTYTYMEACA